MHEPAPQWMTVADPIHGVIRFKRHDANHRLLLDVMNSRAFQRLRRIRQMGMAEFVFPGATHSRFVHSIGAAWLMTKAIQYFQELPETRALMQSTYKNTGFSFETILLLSILVHDIGHAPLSHTLEDILDLKSQGLIHDTYWNRLILTQDPQLQGIWEKHGKGLPEAVLDFSSGGHFLSDLVSSQLDMDRLDYLQRDSHYLGVQYGRVEVERILTNLCIGETPEGKQAVAIREEALPAVEHYLFGRYQAYKMALHALDKASEMLLKKTLERFAWCRDTGIDPGHPAELLYKLMRNGRALTVDEYLMLDDCYLWDKISQWSHASEDTLLRELANRLLGHDLFKYVEIADGAADKDVLEALETHYRQRGLSFEFGFEQILLQPKPLYQGAPVKPPIWVRSGHTVLKDFKDVSSLPLQAESQQGCRHLLFVWDKESQRFLKTLLDKHLS